MSVTALVFTDDLHGGTATPRIAPERNHLAARMAAGPGWPGGGWHAPVGARTTGAGGAPGEMHNFTALRRVSLAPVAITRIARGGGLAFVRPGRPRAPPQEQSQLDGAGMKLS